MRIPLLIAVLLSPTCLVAEWNIEEPTKEISGPLVGEVFGRNFKFGEAIWSKNNVRISSSDKIGSRPAGVVEIWLKNDGTKEWTVMPTVRSFPTPHVYMKFGKEGSKHPGTLVFTSEYCMYLRLDSLTDDIATFSLHLSLPDYKKTTLLGTFEATVKK